MVERIALILAGGEASRLGGISKPEVALAGMRILDRVAARLAPDIDLLLVASGQRDSLGTDAVVRAFVRDLDDKARGPMAGLVAGLDWCDRNGIRNGIIFSAAGDSPLIPPDFVGRLSDAMSPGVDTAVASYDGQPYFTNAAWRIEALAGLADRHRAGSAPKSLKRLSTDLRSVDVPWAVTPEGDPFANANTPQELEELRRRIAGDDAETASEGPRH